MYQGKEYWKNYMERWFGKDLINRWEELVTEDFMQSNGREIHLEVYDSGDPGATTIVFSHGIAGYARVLLPFTIPLREKGYNLIVPDLQGYGYNSGLKGDFEWNAHVDNLRDAVKYAREKFKGKIVLGGASMGGPLAYAAACKTDQVDALVCWCLWDFSDREFMLNETNTGRLTYFLIPFFKLGSLLFGKYRLKTTQLVSYDTLTDSAEMNIMVKNDPQAGTHITLRGAASLVLQSTPEVDHKDFKLPVLVFQPGDDQMTPVYYTRKTFDRLGSDIKEYVELEGAAHFPIQEKYYEIWTNETDKFLKRLELSNKE
ncbi:MAG: alpha/beta hydrolase [Halanaerobiales bacterium]